jgi:hypothetical protein
LIRAERLTLATDRLVYFAHWITPVVQPLRFDTRFFRDRHSRRSTRPSRTCTRSPSVQCSRRARRSTPTPGESSRCANPTIKNLELFDGAPSAAAALDRLRGREIRAILPRVIFEGGKRRVLNPGDPGYDAAAGG